MQQYNKIIDLIETLRILLENDKTSIETLDIIECYLRSLSLKFVSKSSDYPYEAPCDFPFPENGTTLTLDIVLANIELLIGLVPNSSEEKALLKEEYKKLLDSNKDLSIFLATEFEDDGVDKKNELIAILKNLRSKTDPLVSEYPETSLLSRKFCSIKERYKTPQCQVPQYNYWKDIILLLEVLEVHYRKTIENLPSRYHLDRYGHYFLPYIAKYHRFLFLTDGELNLRYFCANKYKTEKPLGVVGECIYADGFMQTPLEFLVHDCNHARREHAYIKQLLRCRGKPTDDLGILHDEFQSNTEKLIALTTIRGKNDIKETQTKKMILVILFEFLHELALTPTEEHWVEMLEFKGGISKSPFEIMSEDAEIDYEDEVLKRRMENANIKNGLSCIKEGVKFYVHYFSDTGPDIAEATLNKLLKQYYTLERSKELPEPEYMTPDVIYEAMKRISEALGVEIGGYISREDLIERLENQEKPYLPSFSDLKPGLLDHANSHCLAASKKLPLGVF
ncbi:MAG: hypothetical protein OEY79_00200 [Anaplasmataceae bacterium]|nr:hypothetical protein [Anaplasmataceae bacterium]